MDLFELSTVQNEMYIRQHKTHNMHDTCAKLINVELILG